MSFCISWQIVMNRRESDRHKEAKDLSKAVKRIERDLSKALK